MRGHQGGLPEGGIPKGPQVHLSIPEHNTASPGKASEIGVPQSWSHHCGQTRFHFQRYGS